jgi:hypothetical protein
VVEAGGPPSSGRGSLSGGPGCRGRTR